jgi:hypothetical protein
MNRGRRVKYPKTAAAFDELLSKIVRENGETFVQFAMELAMKEPAGPFNEKLPPIPTTKEVVDGD